LETALLWTITQRVVVVHIDVLGQPIGRISITNNPNFLESWPLTLGRLSCPETSARNNHYSLRNIQESAVPIYWAVENLSYSKTVLRETYCPRAMGWAEIRWREMHTQVPGRETQSNAAKWQWRLVTNGLRWPQLGIRYNFL